MCVNEDAESSNSGTLLSITVLMISLNLKTYMHTRMVTRGIVRWTLAISDVWTLRFDN